MATELGTRFMQALREAEESGDVEGLLALFDADAELSNLSAEEPHRGRDGAKTFWTDYLKAFDRVRSRFTHVLDGNGLVVLEWVSEATVGEGENLSYRGVSVLETDGDLVTKFRTYYDTAALRPAAALKT